jgi:hypothetical protein
MLGPKLDLRGVGIGIPEVMAVCAFQQIELAVETVAGGWKEGLGSSFDASQENYTVPCVGWSNVRDGWKGGRRRARDIGVNDSRNTIDGIGELAVGEGHPTILGRRGAWVVYVWAVGIVVSDGVYHVNYETAPTRGLSFMWHSRRLVEETALVYVYVYVYVYGARKAWFLMAAM